MWLSWKWMTETSHSKVLQKMKKSLMENFNFCAVATQRWITNIADDHIELNYGFEMNKKEHLQKGLVLCFIEKRFPEKSKNVWKTL